MNDFEDIFCKIFPDSNEANRYNLSLDPNRIRRIKKYFEELAKHDRAIDKILRLKRNELKRKGLSPYKIRKQIDGLKIYLQYQHGTGIPLGHPAYVTGGMFIYPDGHYEYENNW